MEDVNTRLDALTTTLENFIIESRQSREQEKSIRKREDVKRFLESEQGASEYQRNHTFLKQHGFKIAGVIFSAFMAFLAWYGNSILNTYKQQERDKHIDEKIKENTNSITQFKVDSTGEMSGIKNEIIEQRVMFVEAVNRLEEIMMIAHPKLKEDSIPEKPPILQTAEDQVKRDKARINFNK